MERALKEPSWKTEIDGRLYAVIDTHSDLTKGTRYLVPHNKEFDHIMKHRHVEFDGHKMAQKAVEHDISKGLGRER